MIDWLRDVFHVANTAELVWVLIGLFGQMMFSARFLVQWIASERARKSIVPVTFWYFSLAGGIVLFSYALYRRDPVFILGQGLGLTVYLRNLALIRTERRRDHAGE